MKFRTWAELVVLRRSTAAPMRLWGGVGGGAGGVGVGPADL